MPRDPLPIDVASAAIGIPGLYPHQLRHTAASLCFLHGVPARVVMEMMGHSTIRLTMDTYTHVLENLQHEAAANIAAMLRRAT